MRRSKHVATLAIVAVLALPAATLAQGNTPPPCPGEWEPPDTSITWATPSASLEADAIEMRWGDCFFAGVGPTWLHSDPGSPTYRTLEIEWQEQGAPAAINVYFAADESDWWVTEMRTPAGEFHDHPSLPYDLSEVFRTPRGESFEGDVFLPSGPGPDDGLTISGLRLTAFAPGSGPAPLPSCEPAAIAAEDLGKSPLAKGQPLHGTRIRKMTPQRAEALLRKRGICFTFRYGYPIEGTESGHSGSQRWCTAPPDGVIEDLLYLDDGEVVVFVEDDQPRPHVPQPPEGMNCPAQ